MTMFGGISCMQKYPQIDAVCFPETLIWIYPINLNCIIFQKYKTGLCLTPVYCHKTNLDYLWLRRRTVAVCTWYVSRPRNIDGHLSSCDCPAMMPAAERRRKLKEAWRYAGTHREHIRRKVRRTRVRRWSRRGGPWRCCTHYCSDHP